MGLEISFYGVELQLYKNNKGFAAMQIPYISR
mgnify:FL=1